MSNRDYLRKYCDNLIETGALTGQPGERDYCITITAYRPDEPWPVGAWIAAQLTAEPHFDDLLFASRLGDLEVTRIDSSVFSPRAPEFFGHDVYDRLQDLLDVIDANWKRTHP